MVRWQAVKAMVRQAGWAASIAHGADRVLRWLGWGHVHHYVFLAQPVAEPAAAHAASRHFDCRELAAGDAALRQLPLADAVLEYRFGQQAVAVGAFDGKRLAAVVWYTVGPYEEDEVRAHYIPLPAGRTAWDFGVYVAPAHRLGRAFASVWAAAEASMHARGVTWTLSRVNRVNAASVAAHRRLGARAIGWATFLRLGMLQIAWSNRWPWLHMGLRPAARPVYRLSAPLRTEAAGPAAAPGPGAVSP
ncbi:MAG: hypothetical protein D6782_03740 [Alphaproteobacteria bacterium]|nr:MAG: hypothetical protein D6782_03740 [Alphaproteobacteria bacterium]